MFFFYYKKRTFQSDIYGATADADIKSLKSLHYCLISTWAHAGKILLTRKVQTTQKFELFDKKMVNYFFTKR